MYQKNKLAFSSMFYVRNTAAVINSQIRFPSSNSIITKASVNRSVCSHPIIERPVSSLLVGSRLVTNIPDTLKYLLWECMVEETVGWLRRFYFEIDRQ